MGELYEKIFWLNMFRNGGSFSAGTVAQPKTEWWLNLAGLSAQKDPEYSAKALHISQSTVSDNLDKAQRQLKLIWEDNTHE